MVAVVETQVSCIDRYRRARCEDRCGAAYLRDGFVQVQFDVADDD